MAKVCVLCVQPVRPVKAGCLSMLCEMMHRMHLKKKWRCNCRVRQWMYGFWGFAQGWREVGCHGRWITSPHKPDFEPPEDFVPRTRMVPARTILRHIAKREREKAAHKKQQRDAADARTVLDLARCINKAL